MICQAVFIEAVFLFVTQGYHVTIKPEIVKPVRYFKTSITAFIDR